MTSQLLAAALSVALGPASSSAPQGNPPPSSPFFPGIAYAEIGGVSGFAFVQVRFGSETVEIGPMAQYFPSGGFANGDYTVEYAIAYPAGDLYSIDTSDATTTLIGPTDTPESIPYGPRWNPQTGTSYVIAPNASCSASNLYTIDLSTGATTLVGASDTCISAIAIDPAAGTMYGFDLLADDFVVIDESTGETQFVGSFGISLSRVDAMDFDPANGLLYVIGESTDLPDPNLYAFVPPTGLELVGPAGGVAFAFAQRDGFFNGFEKPGFGSN